jgi:hypothetical protein
MKNKYFNALLLSTLMLTLSACGSDTESSIQTPMSEVDLGIQTSVTNTIIVAVDGFSENITTLNTHIDSFCSAVNSDNLSILQNTWQASFVGWYALMPFQVGPLTLTDDNSAILNYVDFYRNATRASRTSNLADINSGLGALMSGGAVTDASLSNTLTKNVGLLVLETALFSTISNSTATADIVAEFTDPSKKCDIIQALGYELNERASDIQSQWKTDYRSTGLSYLDLFTSNLLENYFSSFDSQGDGVGTPASETLIVALQEFLDFAGNADLFIELTRYSSDLPWDALAASIHSIESILDQSEKTELSLYAIIKSNGYGQDVETIRQNIAIIRQTIRDKNIVDFKAVAKALDGNFKTSVIDGLNINKGLTFADGDS